MIVICVQNHDLLVVVNDSPTERFYLVVDFPKYLEDLSKLVFLQLASFSELGFQHVNWTRIVHKLFVQWSSCHYCVVTSRASGIHLVFYG